MSAALAHADDAFTPRQQQVLTAALELLVQQGDALTMTAVAQRASCSKETLYKWFGGRDGLLAAIVQWQAAKVRAPHIDRARLDAATLERSLVQFAQDLLATLTGEVSVALNRLAITHAASNTSELGPIMRAHGPAAVRGRLIPVLEAARAAGLLAFASSEDAYRTFFGLVVRDTQIRLLLGEPMRLSSAQLSAAATQATMQFLALHGPTTNAKRGD